MNACVAVLQGAGIVKELTESPSSHLVYVGPTAHGRSGLSTGVLIAIIAGGAVAGLVLLLIVCKLCCKKKPAAGK